MLASEEFCSVYVDKRGLAKHLVNDEGMGGGGGAVYHGDG